MGENTKGLLNEGPAISVPARHGYRQVMGAWPQQPGQRLRVPCPTALCVLQAASAPTQLGLFVLGMCVFLQGTQGPLSVSCIYCAILLPTWSLLFVSLVTAASVHHLRGPQLGGLEDELVAILCGDRTLGRHVPSLTEVWLLWEQGHWCLWLRNYLSFGGTAMLRSLLHPCFTQAFLFIPSVCFPQA